MNFFVIHGEDEIKSYARFSKFVSTAKDRSWEVVYLTGEKLNLVESLSAGSLFSKEKFFVLDDIKKLGKKEIEWLRKKSEKLEGNLVIYHRGNIPGTLLKSFPPETSVEEFKVPKLIFTFLEKIEPGSASEAIKLLHETTVNNPVEFVFSLLSKQIRDLFWVKAESSTLSYPDWRIGKLKVQASKFSLGQLRYLIQKLAAVDVLTKTTSTDLSTSLDLILATQLE